MNHPSQSPSRPRRSFIFWIFLLIAIPIAILIVGYAAGYTYDRSTNSVIMTSALAVETTPDEVSILLDGIEQGDNTPLFVNTIQPGEHMVELQKAGYHTWKKRVAFDPGKSVVFSDVILFILSQPEKRQTAQRTKKNDGLLALPPEYHSYYRELGWDSPAELQYLPGPLTVLVDPQVNVSYLIPALNEFNEELRIDTTIQVAEWFEEEQLLYITDNELWIFDKNTRTNTLLTRQSTTIFDARWHTEGSYLFFSTDFGLFAMELDDRDRRQVWTLSTLAHPEQLQLTDRGRTIQFVSENIPYNLQLYPE
jgi:hypothetical protein